METIEIKFCEALFQWKKDHFQGTQAELGEFLGVSQGQVARLLSGTRCGDETWRRRVAKRIGIPYDVMIGVQPAGDPAAQKVRQLHKETVKDGNKGSPYKPIFKNMASARNIKRMLLDIDAADPKAFVQIEQIITALHSGIAAKKKCAPAKL